MPRGGDVFLMRVALFLVALEGATCSSSLTLID